MKKSEQSKKGINGPERLDIGGKIQRLHPKVMPPVLITIYLHAHHRQMLMGRKGCEEGMAKTGLSCCAFLQEDK